ncbi:MAG: SgcJ/EcaC family oxidoreductase [Proteobacteria bacterium]|nr:SgcJ/EcaC family oxidoreductase [Pseudomonadota bacterium]
MRAWMAAFGLVAALAAGAAEAEDLVASARPTIAKADADWIGAMQAGDAARLAAPYAEDGVFVTPDGTAIAGRAAIEAFYRKRLKASKAKIVGGGVRYDNIVVGGTAAQPLVYEWGHGGAVSVDEAGKRSAREGAYLTVWKRGADGAWRIVRNMAF